MFFILLYIGPKPPIWNCGHLQLIMQFTCETKCINVFFYGFHRAVYKALLPSYDSLFHAHMFGCPVFVLDPRLQYGKQLSKWLLEVEQENFWVIANIIPH